MKEDTRLSPNTFLHTSSPFLTTFSFSLAIAGIEEMKSNKNFAILNTYYAGVLIGNRVVYMNMLYYIPTVFFSVIITH